MLRRLFVDAASVSLLLFIGTAMFWLRNRSSVELLAVARGNWPDKSRLYSARAVSFAAADGRVSLSFGHWGFDFSHPGEIDGSPVGLNNPLQYRRRNPGELSLIHQQHALGGAYALPGDWHGFKWSVTSFRNRGQWEESRGLTLPVWLILLLTAVLPAGGAIKTARRYLRGRPSRRRLPLRALRWRGRTSRAPGGAAIA